MRFKFFPLAKTLDLFWSLQAAPHSIHHTLVYNILEHKGAFVLSRTKSHTVHNPAEITAILAMRQAKSKTTAVFECQTIFVFFFLPMLFTACFTSLIAVTRALTFPTSATSLPNNCVNRGQHLMCALCQAVRVSCAVTVSSSISPVRLDVYKRI